MDLAFYRNLAILNGLVPALILAWDAWHGQLGANAVNNAIHVTGILSLIFLFLSLLITPLRTLTGWNSLIAYRRALGLYGFFYALVHFVIYVALDRMGSLASTWDEIVSRRFLTIGFVGLMLMIPLAITSTNGMIRNLGPTRWKLLHRLAYVAAALGVLHYFLLVKSDVRQPLAFAAVLTPMLGFRVVKHYTDLRQAARRMDAKVLQTAKKPGTAFWKGSMRVANIVDESHDVKTFRMVPTQGDELPFLHQPGQYLSLVLPVDGNTVRRSYTIASSPTQRGYVEITVKRDPNGLVSRHLHDNVRIGETLLISAPAGKFWFDGKSSDRVLLIAGGVGVTPVMSILRSLTDHVWMGSIDFVYVMKTCSDFVFENELRRIVTRFPNVRFHRFVTRETIDGTNPSNERWRELAGYPDALELNRMVLEPRSTPTYLCGPQPMMDAMRSLLVEAGFAKDRIFTEVFESPQGSEVQVGPSANRVSGNATQEASVPSTVVFQRSMAELALEPEQSILEGAENGGIALPFECRSGICGQCKVKCTEGRVRMEVTDALSKWEHDAGYILACQAKALDSRIVIEA